MDRDAILDNLSAVPPGLDSQNATHPLAELLWNMKDSLRVPTMGEKT
jgi:hypothetical protein